MPDREEKIFPALPQKRQRAREEGHVARSRDLTSAISFVAAIMFLAGGTPLVARYLLGAFRQALAVTGSPDLATAMGRALIWPLMISFVLTLVLASAAVTGAAAQGGFIFTFPKVLPDFTRLNPLSYFGRIFSSAGLVELGKAALKVILVIVVGWKTARWGLDLAAGAHDIPAALAALALASRRILYISLVIALVAAAADYAHKYHEHETELRMTRQEFLEQLKQDEGHPIVKRAIRKAQRQRKHKRVAGIHQAATATVVLTNPTHFAVALRYRRGFDPAPLVVAKGAGEQAQRIKEVARLAAVPVLENKPLARALFKSVEVGDQLPRQFYRAIAEVFATIMRAEARREKPQGVA
jgi:flagellar biosynthesis protein FlhB